MNQSVNRHEQQARATILNSIADTLIKRFPALANDKEHLIPIIEKWLKSANTIPEKVTGESQYSKLNEEETAAIYETFQNDIALQEC